MFKKILSSLTIMLVAFSMNAGAQKFEAHESDAVSRIMPRYAARNAITSKIELGADEFWTGYWKGNLDKNLTTVGVQAIPMHYDVAICYPAESAVISGMTIEGIRLSFPRKDYIEDVKVWMSTSLPQSPEDADIIIQDVKEITDLRNEADPLIEVRFDKPYKYDITKDLYIGYSFEVTGGNSEDEKFPILIYTDEDEYNAMWLKFGGADVDWANYNGYGFGKLAIQVLVSGSYPENSMVVNSDLGSSIGLAGTEVSIPLTIKNAGTKSISTMSMKVTLNGETSSVYGSLPKPLAGIGSETTVELDVDLPKTAGCYEIGIRIDSINGVSVEGPEAEGKLYAVSRIEERIPFLEEFTAMWCGWCPRGIVALEKLRADYGDKISLVTIHSGDAIEIKSDYDEILLKIMNVPSAQIDRVYFDADPYYGYSEYYSIKDLVESCKQIVPAAVVDASASVDGDILTAKSETEFLYSGDASGFSLAYVLTENGLEDPSWRQSNFFSGLVDDGYIEEDPMFEPWVMGDEYVKGVVYDDVAIAAKGIISGIDGSVPAEVKEGVKNQHSVEFDLNDYSVIQNREKLNLVVVVIDRQSGRIVNSRYVPVNAAAGIEGIGADVSETARYTVDGRMISVPEKGINIVRYSDGTVRKVIVK